MKQILAILTLFIMLTACETVEDNTIKTDAVISAVPDENKDISALPDENKETVFESDVRLTSQGFDADEITVKKGESLTIIIEGKEEEKLRELGLEKARGHYLTIDGERIAQKELEDQDKINIPFDKEGTFEIFDETSKQSLTVNVE